MRPLFFLRLSKTGSTTLATLIGHYIPAERTCPSIFQHDIVNLGPDDLARYDFIHGHIDLAFIEERLADVAIITLLREPKSRILSAYFRWRERVEENTVPVHETAVMAAAMSVEDYLARADDAIRRSVWNFQARTLAGGSWGGDFARHQQVFGPDLTDQQIVDRARAALDRMAFVGVTDRMNEVVSAFFRQMNWEPPAEIPRLNATTRKDQAITERAEALLGEFTELDRIVYDHAAGLFESRVA